MSYYIDSNFVYYQNEGLTQLVGSLTKVETERINNTMVADVTYEFDLEQGRYVEENRTLRADVLVVTPTESERIKVLEDTLLDLMLGGL